VKSENIVMAALYLGSLHTVWLERGVEVSAGAWVEQIIPQQ